MRDRRQYSQASSLVPAALHTHKARVAAARARGIDVIDLGSADAHHGPPHPVVERLVERLSRNSAASLYSIVPGVEALRTALARDLGVPEANVLVTAGANNGVVLALLATTRVGDAVATPAPFFFNHATQAELLGLDLVPVVTTSADGHCLSRDAFAAAIASERVRVGLISSPRNPTATLIDTEALGAAAQACDKPLIIDESYREFGGTQAQRGWSAEGGVIRIGSLSKSFGLAGWRVGYAIVPDAWIDAMVRAQDALMIHAAVASQYAALEALVHRGSDDYVQSYAARIVVEQASMRARMESLPWVLHVSGDSATFLWVTLQPGQDPDAFAARLLEDGVGVLSSSAFGGEQPAFRLGVACVDPADLARAWNRLSNLT
jgi:aspartate/methionine/tyrosine aminotransferase